MAHESFNITPTTVGHLPDKKSVMNQLLAQFVPIATVIVIANMVVFVLFARKRSLRTPTNLFLLSLSISDCANGMVNIPVFFTVATWWSAAGAVAVIVLHNFTLTLTGYHILAITADKYFAIMKPFWRRSSLTKRFVSKTIVAIWLISATIAALEIPTLRFFTDSAAARRIYLVFYFIAVFVFPFAFMFYAYIVMFYNLRKRKILAQRRHHNQVCKNLLNDWKCLLIFIAMLIVFIVCWCPSFAIRMVLDFGDPQEWKNSSQFSTVMHVCTIIRYGSSVLNPLLYTLLKTDFLAALKTITRSSSTIEHRQHSSTAITRKGTFSKTPLIVAKYSVRKPVMLDDSPQIGAANEQGTDKTRLVSADAEYEIELLTVI